MIKSAAMNKAQVMAKENESSWWENFKNAMKEVKTKDMAAMDKSITAMSTHVGRAFRRMVLWVLIFYVAGYFVPELHQKIPTLYQACDGVMQVLEFLVRTTMGFFGSILKLNLFEFFRDMFAEIGSMFSQFVNWLSSITF